MFRLALVRSSEEQYLYARLLGQYVLHLLERISEVVDGAVASRQPYSRAVTEIQKIEAKLKERVLATLH